MKKLFIISLCVISFLSTTKSIAQLITASNYFEDIFEYNPQYFFPFLTESFSNTHLNSYIWNYDLQAFLWPSSTSLPFFQYFPYYNHSFNFWQSDFYNHLDQGPGDSSSSKNPNEQSIDEASEEIKVIIEDDSNKTFTFHVGDEFIVNLPHDYWDINWTTYNGHWLEKEEISLKNGYGFEKVELPPMTASWSYHYRAIQPGENELVFNYCVSWISSVEEGPNREWMMDIRDTFKITIRIID